VAASLLQQHHRRAEKSEGSKKTIFIGDQFTKFRKTLVPIAAHFPVINLAVRAIFADFCIDKYHAINNRSLSAGGLSESKFGSSNG